MPSLALFIGKGGVGKTTISSAYAAHTAAARPRESRPLPAPVDDSAGGRMGRPVRRALYHQRAEMRENSLKLRV